MKVCITTLGCDKNRVDSEQLAGYLANAGFTFTDDDSIADIIIVNTCGFINSARKESIDVITSKLQYKPKAKIVVCGCIVENNRKDLESGLPEIDVWWGTKDYKKLAELLSQKNIENSIKKLSTPKSYTYIKIAEGCNRNCAFCTIPSIRGRYESKPLEDIITEIEYFSNIGVSEFILVAQDVTYYGLDIKTNLVELLKKITELPKVKKVRLHYCYPDLLSDSLLYEIANNKKVAKYLDIPFQHCNGRILKLMHRKGNEKDFAAIIEKIRKIIKGVTIRATFIVGFPTETDEEFEELINFLCKVKLDYVGFFAYSRESNTVAYSLEQVKSSVKSSRLKKVEKIQKEILINKDRQKKGSHVRVICDEVKDGVAICRTEGQSPNVDPCIFVKENFVVGEEYDIII